MMRNAMWVRAVGACCLGLVTWSPVWGEEPKLRATLKGHKQRVFCVAYSPDGGTLASGGSDGTIKLWDLKTGKEQATFEGHTGSVFSVAYSPDGKALASGSEDGTIKLWTMPGTKKASK